MSLFGPKQPVGSTQDSLKFGEIHNDTVILKDRNLRQVLLCSSINFALKSEQEQNAIIFAYQNFLNSLHFPIQILMQSKKLDLSNYLAKLTGKASGQTNELLRAQTLDYIDFIKRLINLANIMDKRFYVVIPYLVPPKLEAIRNPMQPGQPITLTAEEFGQYQKELEQRAQVIESGLSSIGIRTARLNTQQLIELLYGVYNPEEASKEKLTEAENLAGAVVKSEIFKEEGEAFWQQPANATPGNAKTQPPPRPAPVPAFYQQGMTSVLDLIAPAAFKIEPNYLQLGNLYVRTLFVFTYPRYVQTNWLSPIINYDITMDVSMFVYPIPTKEMMTTLRKKAGQLESSLAIEREKGMVRNPELETAVQNIDSLRDVLQKGEMRLFQFALYFTIYAKSVDELNTITEQLESTLGGMLIYTKQSLLQMEQGFNSSLPLGIDELKVIRNLDTASLSTTFPFTSATLSSNDGILYGLNRHNNSLILFDRFNLENANAVVFAKAGAGKSYAIKLEVLRSLMLGTDVIVIDPENEYKTLCEAAGGNYLNISLNSDKRMNPFDLPKAGAQVQAGASGDDILRSNITMLHGLVSLMMTGLSPDEDAILEKALYETYALKDITADIESQKNPPPLLADLQSVLSNMTGAETMGRKLSKYTEGTFKGLFDKPTNFELDSGFIVFSVRDLEETLRPIAMYMILNYVWQRVRFNIKRRILVIDEAWWMMQHEDSGRFLYALSKRARKYYLGLTIISQDVEDFIGSKFGRSVINNSSMQILMKQSTASIDKVASVFGLTEGEKFLLLECEVGEGLFFAGLNHVALKVIASYTEDQLITTDPQQLLEMQVEFAPSDLSRLAPSAIEGAQSREEEEKGAEEEAGTITTSGSVPQVPEEEAPPLSAPTPEAANAQRPPAVTSPEQNPQSAPTPQPSNPPATANPPQPTNTPLQMPPM